MALGFSHASSTSRILNVVSEKQFWWKRAYIVRHLMDGQTDSLNSVMGGHYHLVARGRYPPAPARWYGPQITAGMRLCETGSPGSLAFCLGAKHRV